MDSDIKAIDPWEDYDEHSARVSWEVEERMIALEEGQVEGEENEI